MIEPTRTGWSQAVALGSSSFERHEGELGQLMGPMLGRSPSNRAASKTFNNANPPTLEQFIQGHPDWHAFTWTAFVFSLVAPDGGGAYMSLTWRVTTFNWATFIPQNQDHPVPITVEMKDARGGLLNTWRFNHSYLCPVLNNVLESFAAPLNPNNFETIEQVAITFGGTLLYHCV